MAKCELTIELDDPERTRIAGEPIKGTVVVRAEQSVNCKGLDVACVWATHGRGNIQRGEIDGKTLFSGSWDAGLEYRYPFELNTAAWPPTYYGTFLNVSQMVEARAKLPWSFDPKTSVEFPVVATTSPEDLAPVDNKRAGSSSMIGWVIGIIILIVFIPLLIMALGMALVFLVPIALIGGGLFWFFRVFLPSRVTGPVECDVKPLRVAAGESLAGSLKFAPPRDLKINGIQFKVTAKEKCVSGSGSNRSTHVHTVLETFHTLAKEGQLPYGMPQSFDFKFPLPENAPPSLKFTENELIWEGEMRIDIPSWPDWTKTFKLTVTPAPTVPPQDQPRDRLPAPAVPVVVPSSSDLSFDEVAGQIVMSADDPARRQLIVDAVLGQAFTVRADLDEWINPQEAPGSGTGAWVLARHRGTELPLSLVWPDGSTPPRTPSSGWQGVATVAAYDERTRRVVMHAAAS